MDLSAVGRTARQGDPTRFEAAMFAPERRREDLFALIALNAELSRIPESVSEPMLGEIRLQWWEDAISALFEGERVEGHEVIEALAGPVSDGRLSKDRLINLIDARRLILSGEAMGDAAILGRMIEQTGGALAALQIAALGGDDKAQDVAANAGWAEGAGRLIGALPAITGEGQVDEDAARSGNAPPTLASLVETLAADALQKLQSARADRNLIPHHCRAPLLSLKQAERRLKAVILPGANIFMDDGAVSPFRERLSLFARALSGRF
jgi:phytoene synthase